MNWCLTCSLPHINCMCKISNSQEYGECRETNTGLEIYTANEDWSNFESRLPHRPIEISHTRATSSASSTTQDSTPSQSSRADTLSSPILGQSLPSILTHVTLLPKRSELSPIAPAKKAGGTGGENMCQLESRSLLGHTKRMVTREAAREV